MVLSVVVVEARGNFHKLHPLFRFFDDEHVSPDAVVAHRGLLF